MKIGALAKATGAKAETVRYYEKIGLLPPPARTTANYRDYGSDHLARLLFICRARDRNFTLGMGRVVHYLELLISKAACGRAQLSLESISVLSR
ncbi:MerR family transcriptional regulator [Parasphingorhabdus sp.]|uniref:MerR family transcriptional regulator n=1 Tax=Parasphingorhabdus sp. TaxID=2709688 RepID=UPI0039C95380